MGRELRVIPSLPIATDPRLHSLLSQLASPALPSLPHIFAPLFRTASVHSLRSPVPVSSRAAVEDLCGAANESSTLSCESQEAKGSFLSATTQTVGTPPPPTFLQPSTSTISTDFILVPYSTRWEGVPSTGTSAPTGHGTSQTELSHLIWARPVAAATGGTTTTTS